MTLMKDLLDILPQQGTIESISIRPKKKAEPVCIDSVQITTDSAIKGDHYNKKDGDRMVTLIQSEHLAAFANILKKPALNGVEVESIDPTLTRRNIVVSGINLLALHNRKFQIGDEVILEGTGYCQPCSRMEQNLGEGGYNAMRGHGGITAKVIKGGTISKSDRVNLIV